MTTLLTILLYSCDMSPKFLGPGPPAPHFGTSFFGAEPWRTGPSATADPADPRPDQWRFDGLRLSCKESLPYQAKVAIFLSSVTCERANCFALRSVPISPSPDAMLNIHNVFRNPVALQINDKRLNKAKNALFHYPHLQAVFMPL